MNVPVSASHAPVYQALYMYTYVPQTQTVLSYVILFRLMEVFVVSMSSVCVYEKESVASLQLCLLQKASHSSLQSTYSVHVVTTDYRGLRKRIRTVL